MRFGNLGYKWQTWESFAGNAAANALIKPYIRAGWEF